jgi:hypothetical protein
MALKTFKLTDSGDIELDSEARPTVLLGKLAAEQLVKASISLWRGNWAFDETRGVDWLRILKKNYTRSEIVQVFTQAILKVSVVEEVLDLFINVGADPDKPRVAQMTYLIIVDGQQVEGSIEL